MLDLECKVEQTKKEKWWNEYFIKLGRLCGFDLKRNHPASNQAICERLGVESAEVSLIHGEPAT